MRLRKFLFDCYDITYAFIVFIVFHKRNTLNERHIRFIDHANWADDNKIKQKLLKKIKELNNYKIQ